MAASIGLEYLLKDPFETRADSRLCDSCATLFSNPDDVRRFVLRETISRRRRYQSLVESEERGCRLCYLLLSIINGPPSELNTSDGIPAPTKEANNRTGVDSLSIVECLFAGEGEKMTHTVRITYRIIQRPERFRLVVISAHEDDPAAEHFRLRSLNQKFNCHRTFAKVKKWLGECHSSHQWCNNCQLGLAKADAKPTYLINVASDKEVVFLHQTTTEASVKYAALSYRWGSEQPHATTLKNQEAYAKEGIVIQILPRTIQDAIIICKELGLDFLWIDSMCIPQDSPVDLERGLANMGAIYHNAHVVISASSAQSCNEGFLDKRPFQAQPINIPFGESGSINLTSQSSEDSQGFRDSEQPLNSRAWAYQESFMARRLLAFHSREVVWSCCKTCGDSGGMRDPNIAVSVPFSESCRDEHMFLGELRDWGFVVQTYSRKMLTCESDKLPVLAGIAEVFNSGLEKGGDYMAGIFLQEFNQLIAWYMPYLGDDLWPARPAKWRAPSWSYMSIDGPIGFVNLNGSGGPRPTSKYKGFLWKAEIKFKLSSEKNPYGAVTDASMHFRGQLIEVRLGARIEDRRFNVEQLSQPSGFAQTPDEWYVIFDAMIPTNGAEMARISSCYGILPLNDRFWWLPMYHTQWSVNSKHSLETGHRYGERLIGFALACLPDGRFHRVGHIVCNGTEGEVLVEQIEKLAITEFTFI